MTTADGPVPRPEPGRSGGSRLAPGPFEQPWGLLTHVAAAAWDITSGEITWSDELHRILGVTPDEVTPGYETFFACIAPAHQARCEAVVHAALGSGGRCVFEFATIRGDGAERWMRALCVVDSDQAGAPVRMHVTVQDVTDFRAVAGTASTSGMGALDLGGVGAGMASWRRFADRAAAALARAARQGWSTALVVVDIDPLPQVQGADLDENPPDLVLAEVARRLDAAFDTVARLGGDVGRLGRGEFVLLCENVPDAAHTDALCRRVGSVLAPPVRMGGVDVAVTAGVGVAVSPPEGVPVDDLVLQAESAMRYAGQRGPGYEAFDEGVTAADGFRRQAAQELLRAFHANELRVHYQPKVALDTDRIIGVEALLRWQHPERGLVSPAEFVAVAEKVGLIVPIGAWVLEEACRQAARWHRQFPGRPWLTVSVNVSARQFGPRVVEVVARALSSSGIDPGSLCLEVTESLLIEDLGGAMVILDRLAALGVRLSIDDFGTGFSSLSRLKRFPVHELKIDKSFVDGIGVDPDDTAIVAAIIAMAHAMRLSVVAEGVETPDQMQRLRTLGCDQAQGYHLHKPGPPEAIDAWLEAEAATSWDRHADRRRPGAEMSSRSYRPERLLVIDDSADVRQLAVITLASVGFEVHQAVDGASGLAAALLVAPDCILLDLLMPDVSGLEVCRALRTEPVTAACTIVILTSMGDAAEKVEAFSSGADDYIVKPFSPRDLAGRVQAAMRRRREDLRSFEGLRAAQPAASAADEVPT